MQLTPEASYTKPNARRMLDYHFTIYASYPILLALVAQKVDSTIHWIAQLVSLTLIHWIVIYPVDSAIQLLNNWGLHYNARPKE